MSLCILTGAGIVRLAVATFTLGWSHSVEHTRWREDWRVTPQGLEVVEARIEGTGAGMEMPPDSTFDGTWWRYRPHVPPLPEVLLRRSDAVPEGWRLCAEGKCRQIGDARETADVVVMKPCR